MSAPFLVGYVILIAVTLLACGYLAGWLARGDRNERDHLDQVEAQVRTAHGRHAQASPRRRPAASTGELAALYGQEYPEMTS